MANSRQFFGETIFWILRVGPISLLLGKGGSTQTKKLISFMTNDLMVHYFDKISPLLRVGPICLQLGKEREAQHKLVKLISFYSKLIAIFW